jgi:tungstate transport system ATP-binding protein
MRAPASNLPIVFAAVMLRRGSVTILDAISLTITSGTPTVLIGPNGAGKTMLLKLACALIEPTSGEITWGGTSRTDPTQSAIVLQRPTMLRRSAAANVRYALAAAGCPRRERSARLAALLEQVGLGEFTERPARRLSGGEQQRLAFARALAKDPAILFLDEPTASLDPAATKAMEDLIRRTADANIKVVMSTHDLGQARRLAGDVVLLHRGRIVEHADVASFFTSPQTPQARSFVAGELLV